MPTTDASSKPDPVQGDGVTLQTVIESARRLDELSCARVIGQLALAVHAAQKGGQPLGSITPAAVRLSADGEVVLGSGVPSPRYAAPERLRGGAGDRRTDVFALGALLWEALAHERLFEGATDDAIKLAVMRDELRPPSEHNANVPAELDAICKKALARDPAERYPSAKVMAAELEAVLDDAGYPESNEQIAGYVGKLLAAAAPAVSAPVPHAPRPPLPSKTAQLPAALVLPAEPAEPRKSTGTLPPPIVEAAALRKPAAKTELLGSVNDTLIDPAEAAPAAAAEAAPAAEAARPLHIPKPVEEVVPLDAPKPAAKPLAATAFLGSNAVGSGLSATSTMLGVSPLPVVPPAPPANPFSLANLSNLPAASIPAPVHTPTLLGMPALAEPTEPSLASAETVGTPQLAMPAPPDREFEDERHSAPVEILAPPRPRETTAGVGDAIPTDRASGSRDVLAGWGWGTGPVQVVDEPDDYQHTSRAGRRRLILAIAGALGVVVLIAVAALAFSGGDKPVAPAPAPVATAPAPPPPTTPSSDPGTGSASAAASPASTASGAGSAAAPTPDVATAAPAPAPPAADKSAPALPSAPSTPAPAVAGEAPSPAPAAAPPAPAPAVAVARPAAAPRPPEPVKPRPDVHAEPKKPVAVADKPR
ncbi:MAG TPA: hypothetical protein VGC42_16420, partial [Kofleriaceae bacterium]